MGKLSELLGRDEEQEFQGKTYALARRTPNMDAEWEEWLLQKARRGLQRQRAVLLAEEWAEECDRLNDDVAAGRYDLLSPRSLNAMAKSLDGMEQLLYLRLTYAKANGLTPEQARALAHGMAEAAVDAAVEKLEAARKNGHADPRESGEGAAGPFAEGGATASAST